jgi:hypothetical protein
MKQVLIYDVNAFPSDTGLDIQRLLGFYEEKGILFWSSSNPSAVEPKVLSIPEGIDIKVIDVKTEEGKELFTQLYNEDTTSGVS